MNSFIQINHLDNVAVALHPLKKGSILNVNGSHVTLIEDIPQGHKFALGNIKEKEAVIKYGYPIGYATKDILKGSHVHIHNLKTGLNDLLQYQYHSYCWLYEFSSQSY